MSRMVCPSCKEEIEHYKNPVPTVDIVIELQHEIVLIQRKNPPLGWALPGGFVDYGETVEQAAVREAKEETSLDVILFHMLGVYSRPDRDPRFHTISTVFVATGSGRPWAQDDAKGISLFQKESLPHKMAFDHRLILKDYYWWKNLSEGCEKPGQYKTT
jgi:ADP-ribose pyrophosphatase YjhB (NUDIX family)